MIIIVVIIISSSIRIIIYISNISVISITIMLCITLCYSKVNYMILPSSYYTERRFSGPAPRCSLGEWMIIILIIIITINIYIYITIMLLHYSSNSDDIYDYLWIMIIVR